MHDALHHVIHGAILKVFSTSFRELCNALEDVMHDATPQVFSTSFHEQVSRRVYFYKSSRLVRRGLVRAAIDGSWDDAWDDAWDGPLHAPRPAVRSLLSTWCSVLTTHYSVLDPTLPTKVRVVSDRYGSRDDLTDCVVRYIVHYMAHYIVHYIVHHTVPGTT